MRAENNLNQFIGMFQDFIKQQSDAKYNPNTEVGGIGKKVKDVDNIDTASAT
jgi:hypothetical protein